MWNLLNPLDPTYSYGNRVHVQRRVHACGSDSNRAQSSACMRDLACNLSASLVCKLSCDRTTGRSGERGAACVVVRWTGCWRCQVQRRLRTLSTPYSL